MKSCPTCSRTYADDIEFCPHDATRLNPAVNGTEAQLAADSRAVIALSAAWAKAAWARFFLPSS